MLALGLWLLLAGQRLQARRLQMTSGLRMGLWLLSLTFGVGGRSTV